MTEEKGKEASNSAARITPLVPHQPSPGLTWPQSVVSCPSRRCARLATAMHCSAPSQPSVSSCLPFFFFPLLPLPIASSFPLRNDSPLGLGQSAARAALIRPLFEAPAPFFGAAQVPAWRA